MKYFSINYLWKTFLLILPIFKNQINNINCMYILPNMPANNNNNIDFIYNIAKNNTCIHEAGHTINILKSNFKDNFDFLIAAVTCTQINDSNGIKNECVLEGKTIYKTNLYDHLNINELKQNIRIAMGGKAADELYNINENYAELPNRWLIDEYKKRFSLYTDNDDLRTSEEKLKNIVLNTIIDEKNNAKNIIKNNQIEFDKIVETCNLLEYANKNHIDYILQNHEIPLEAKLRKNQFSNL